MTLHSSPSPTKKKLQLHHPNFSPQDILPYMNNCFLKDPLNSQQHYSKASPELENFKQKLRTRKTQQS